MEFTYFPFERIEKKEKIGNLYIDSLLDIAVNKVFTIYQKPRARDFIDLYFGLKSLKLFDEEIVSVKNIVAGFEIQFQKGNVSLRDITRVRALLLSLQSDRLDLYTALQQNSAKEFAILLNNPKNVFYKPILNEADYDSKFNLSNVGLADMINQAMQNRPDLKLAMAQLATADAIVKLQKAVGVPDVQFQYTYDRNGSYLPN